ncbi:MAG: sulfotransferase family 2 domain-containing protein [Anaerolineae bacterium]
MSAPAEPDGVLIFLHIPKTAGVTLNTIIDRYYPPEAIYHTRIKTLDAFFALTNAEKQPIRCLRGHMPFGLHHWMPRPATYITLLRDPVTRFVSEYYYVRRNPDHPGHNALLEDGTTLHEYAERHGGDTMTRCICGFYDHDARQSWVSTNWTAEEAAQAGDTARRNLATQFQAVGVTERFDEFLLLLRHRLGWRNVFYLKRNVTSGRPAKEALPPETRALIEARHRLDTELYALAHRLLDAQLREAGVTRTEVQAFRLLNRLYTDVWQRYNLPGKIHRGRRIISRLPAKLRPGG